MSPVAPGRPPRGLSDQLKELERAQDDVPLGGFDLDAVVRGGRRRRHRRTAATLVGAAASVAVIATVVSLGPLSNRAIDQGPAHQPIPAPISTPHQPTPTSLLTKQPLPAGLDGDNNDNGIVTAVHGTTQVTITYDRYRCDPALSAEQSVNWTGNSAACENNTAAAGKSPNLIDYGIDEHIIRSAELAPNATFIGSEMIGQFLNKPEGGSKISWFQRPAAQRHVTFAQFKAYLPSVNGVDAVFRLHYDSNGQIDRLEEIYSP